MAKIKMVRRVIAKKGLVTSTIKINISNDDLIRAKEVSESMMSGWRFVRILKKSDTN